MEVIKDKNKMLDYFLAILCIFSSGAVAFQNNNKILSIAIAIITFGILVYKRKTFKTESFKSSVLFIVVYLFTAMIRNITEPINLLGELGSVTLFLVAIFISYSMDNKSFINKICNVVYFLAFTSTIFYFIPFIFPWFPKLFPYITDYAGNTYNNAIVFCYPSYISGFYRNQSIFWESGAFQAVLNLALFLEIYISKNANMKRFIVFSIALILTKSTTGYLIYILLVLGLFFIPNSLHKKRIYKEKRVIAVIAVILILIGVSQFKPVVIDKFLSSSNSYGSFTRRKYDLIVDNQLIFGNFVNFFIGYGEDNYMNKFTQFLNMKGIGVYKYAVSSSSLTAFTAKYGIFVILALLSMYIKSSFAFKDKKKKYLYLILVLICTMTENFIMAPIFLCTAIQLIDNKKNIQEEL